MPLPENCACHGEQLDRIEAKLDALIQSLAEDGDDDDEPTHDLEGNALAPRRDETDPL